MKAGAVFVFIDGLSLIRRGRIFTRNVLFGSYEHDANHSDHNPDHKGNELQMLPHDHPPQGSAEGVYKDLPQMGILFQYRKQMTIQSILHDSRFNTFFSLIVGVGIVCILRPMCTGKDCKENSVVKPPSEKDFDQYVYRMSGGKCYQFTTEITECPKSGDAVEAFGSPSKSGFSCRVSPLHRV